MTYKQQNVKLKKLVLQLEQDEENIPPRTFNLGCNCANEIAREIRKLAEK